MEQGKRFKDMKASELRLGNIVQGMQVTVVKSLSEREINGWNCGSFSGIPLTEEILLKCDFEKINHIDGYSFYSLSKSRKNKCHIHIYEYKTQYMGYSVEHCEFLHQLQHL